MESSKFLPLWEVVLRGAYLPIMSDEAMIVDKTGSIFFRLEVIWCAAIGEKY